MLLTYNVHFPPFHYSQELAPKKINLLSFIKSPSQSCQTEQHRSGQRTHRI